MKSKTCIGVYLDDEVLKRISSLSKLMDISRNKLLSKIVGFGIDCYEQDWALQRGYIDWDSMKSVKSGGQ